MKIRTWEYFIREAFISLKRNKWMTVASVSTVALSLAILGMFIISVLNLNYMASQLESQIEVSVYLQDELEVEERDAIREKISGLAGVDEIKYIDKDAALERFKTRLGEQETLLTALGDVNPLPDSFEVRFKKADMVKAAAKTIERYDGVETVKYGQDVVEKLFEITRIVRILGVVLIVFLALATIFIISNTIRLTVFARRREIGIMKYVGATDWFIRWPFLIEGMLLGFLGSLVATIILRGSYRSLVAKIYDSMAFLPLIPEDPFLGRITFMLLVVGTVIGALGSTISLKRFMNV